MALTFSYKYNLQCLSNLYRICCNRAVKYNKKASKPAKACSNYSEIERLFLINVNCDEKDVYAKLLCTSLLATSC